MQTNEVTCASSTSVSSMEIRMDEGEISKEEAVRRLDEWHAAREG